QSLHLAFHLAEVEEKPPLVRRGAHLHDAPRAQDIFLNSRLDPPHRICSQAEAAVGFDFLDGLHAADITPGADFSDGSAIAAISHGDLRHEPQMAGYKLMRGVGVAMLVITLREHVLLFRLKHGKSTDFLEIAGETTLARYNAWQCLG